jgi:hypothetical protein
MKTKLLFAFFLVLSVCSLANQVSIRVNHVMTIKIYRDLCGDTNAALHGAFTYTTNNASETALRQAATEVGVTNVTVTKISEHWNTVSIDYNP